MGGLNHSVYVLYALLTSSIVAVASESVSFKGSAVFLPHCHASYQTVLTRLRLCDDRLDLYGKIVAASLLYRHLLATRHSPLLATDTVTTLGHHQEGSGALDLALTLPVPSPMFVVDLRLLAYGWLWNAAMPTLYSVPLAVHSTQ